MGGSESKIKLLNQKLILKYDKLNIQDIDKGNLSTLEILPEEPFILFNSPSLAKDEDVQISRSFQDLCRYYAPNFDKVSKLEAEMNKYDKEAKEYLKDSETILSNRNVAPIDIFSYSKKLNLNVKKTHIAYEVIFVIRNAFEDIRRGLNRYSNWLKEADQVKRIEEVGLQANSKNITRPTRIVYAYTKEEKLPSIDDHVEIMQDDLRAEKEARAYLEAARGTFILTYTKEKLKEKESTRIVAKGGIITDEKGQRIPTASSNMYKETEESQDAEEAKVIKTKPQHKMHEDYDYQLEKENIQLILRNPVTAAYEHTYAKSEEKLLTKPTEKRALKKTKSNVFPKIHSLQYHELRREVDELRMKNRELTAKLEAKHLQGLTSFDHTKLTSQIKPISEMGKFHKEKIEMKFPTVSRQHMPLKSWNLIPKKTVISDQNQKVQCMEPALNLELLITGGNLGNLTFWKYNNFINITEHKVMHISNSPITSLAYLNDGKVVICGCKDGTLYKIDITIFSAKLIAQLGSPIRNLTYLLNGYSLLSASGNKIYEIDIVKELVINSIDAHENEVTDLAYIHKKGLLASCSKDKSIKIWNPLTKDCLGILRGHASAINSICFAFSQKFLYIVSCAKDSHITFWNLTDKNFTNTMKMNSIGKKLLYMNDKKTVISANKNGSFILWNLEKDSDRKELSFQKVGYSSAAYFDDGRNIVFGNKDGSIEFWNAFVNDQTL